MILASSSFGGGGRTPTLFGHYDVSQKNVSHNRRNTNPSVAHTFQLFKPKLASKGQHQAKQLVLQR